MITPEQFQVYPPYGRVTVIENIPDTFHIRLVNYDNMLFRFPRSKYISIYPESLIGLALQDPEADIIDIAQLSVRPEAISFLYFMVVYREIPYVPSWIDMASAGRYLLIQEMLLVQGQAYNEIDVVNILNIKDLAEGYDNVFLTAYEYNDLILMDYLFEKISPDNDTLRIDSENICIISFDGNLPIFTRLLNRGVDIKTAYQNPDRIMFYTKTNKRNRFVNFDSKSYQSGEICVDQDHGHLITYMMSKGLLPDEVIGAYLNLATEVNSPKCIRAFLQHQPIPTKLIDMAFSQFIRILRDENILYLFLQHPNLTYDTSQLFIQTSTYGKTNIVMSLISGMNQETIDEALSRSANHYDTYLVIYPYASCTGKEQALRELSEYGSINALSHTIMDSCLTKTDLLDGFKVAIDVNNESAILTYINTHIFTLEELANTSEGAREYLTGLSLI